MSMTESDFPPSGNTDYDRLPVSIKASYTLEQYQWLSGDEKGRLEQSETEPEIFE